MLHLAQEIDEMTQRKDSLSRRALLQMAVPLGGLTLYARRNSTGDLGRPTFSPVRGWAEQGGHPIVTSELSSVSKFRQTYQSALITIYDLGTTTISTIYSDSIGTPKANPFSPSATGFWEFFATAGTYTVQLSGGGLVSPVSMGDYVAGGGGGGDTPGGSSGQVQYNNAGAFGGMTGSSISGSDFTMAGLFKTGGGTLFNEPVQFNLGAAPLALGIASGVHGTPLTNLNPTAVIQRFSSVSGINLQLGFYLSGNLVSGQDLYGVFSYGEFTPNLAGASGQIFNEIAARNRVHLGPSNLGTNEVHSYATISEAVRVVNDVAMIAYYAEVDNLTSQDTVGNLSSTNLGVCFLAHPGGTAKNGAAFAIEGQQNAAFYTGMVFQSGAVYGIGLDFFECTFPLTSTVATNGTTSVVGATGSKFTSELQKNAAVSINGVTYYLAADPSDDTHFTTTVAVPGTQSLLTATKRPWPVRLSNSSFITGISLDSTSTYNLFGIDGSNLTNVRSDFATIFTDSGGANIFGRFQSEVNPTNGDTVLLLRLRKGGVTSVERVTVSAGTTGDAGHRVLQVPV
jgi:hypothetical protein